MGGGGLIKKHMPHPLPSAQKLTDQPLKQGWKLHDPPPSLWDMSKPDIEAFIEQANLYHPTIEFTAETFDTETAFLDTVVYKGTRFKEKSILDAKTHFKQTETFLHTHFTSCHPPNVKKGFVKGEALRILRKNSSETTFEKNNSNLKNNTWWTEAIHNLW